MTDTIPLFPLQTVLFPGGPLKLRIFEPRYLDMIGRCMREGTVFGVARIVSGSEVGRDAKTERIGTTARIVDFEQLKDGLLGILAVGERCFRIESTRQEPNGLNIADVVWLPSEPTIAVPADSAYLAILLQHALPQLAPLYDNIEPRYDDASWVSCRCVELLPLPLPDKQKLLEMQDPLQRLEYLRARVRLEPAGTPS
jgi:Lon protease-like protein